MVPFFKRKILGMTQLDSWMDAPSLLEHTRDIVGERRENYGPPTEHFERTVGMVNAMFGHLLKRPLTPAEWAQIMICDKLARHQEVARLDNLVDVAGYAACASECHKSETML